VDSAVFSPSVFIIVTNVTIGLSTGTGRRGGLTCNENFLVKICNYLKFIEKYPKNYNILGREGIKRRGVG